jgi:hypothetical protein
MSSGFVSGGTNDEPIKRSDEWLAAQQEIEANRQRQAIEARQSQGRSLYDTLKANEGIPRSQISVFKFISVLGLIT